jgi:hypothetical protein
MTGAVRLARITGVLLLGLASAQGCGPDFRADVFVRVNRPDRPAEYPKGKLGLLQPTFARADLLVAYRYLSGGTLDAEEQKGWQPTYDDDEPEWEIEAQQRAAGNYGRGVIPDTPIGRWVLARKDYPDAPPGSISQFRVMRVPVGSGSYEVDYLNCGDDAFRTATLTLADRAARWGKASAPLKDWLRAQDAVFSNCKDGRIIPEAATAGSPALLVADRAYQTAAAEFYSGNYSAARAQFAAIGKDGASPWQPLGGYVAARVLLRQAFSQALDPSKEVNEYDPALMKQAREALRAYLATAPAPPPNLQKAAGALLNLVRIRTEPEVRVRELGALVGGSGASHDPNYQQDATDLLWYVNAKTPEGLRAQPNVYAQEPDEKHPGVLRPATPQEIASATLERRHDAYAATKAERALSPLVDWAITFVSLDPAAGAHALAEWRRTDALPWLVAALALAPEGREPADLLVAAAAMPENSPGWQTAAYHRVRLLLGVGRAAEARAVLGAVVPRMAAESEPSSVNAFRALEMRASPTLAEFVTFVPRTVLLRTSEEKLALDECREVMKNPSRHYNCLPALSPTEMDGDAAAMLNGSAPLGVWAQVARAGSLPGALRQVVAQAGWTRAVLLKDTGAASEFLPLLPVALREQVSADSGIGFSEWMALARNPGLTPYLTGGTQRGYSWDFVESYRENWCYKPPTEPAGSAAFLTAPDKAEGARQEQALEGINAATLGLNIVSYARAHADEPRAAEALYLVLRMVRYGCVEARAPVSKEVSPQTGMIVAGPPPTPEEEALYRLKMDAARLLRERYAASPWTKKAAPFAG